MENVSGFRLNKRITFLKTLLEYATSSGVSIIALLVSSPPICRPPTLLLACYISSSVKMIEYLIITPFLIVADLRQAHFAPVYNTSYSVYDDIRMYVFRFGTFVSLSFLLRIAIRTIAFAVKTLRQHVTA